MPMAIRATAIQMEEEPVFEIFISQKRQETP